MNMGEGRNVRKFGEHVKLVKSGFYCIFPFQETKAFKSEAMTDIVSLVNNIYVYKQGVEAINVTLQVTSNIIQLNHVSDNCISVLLCRTTVLIQPLIE